jgi:hypothetical protein
MGRGSVRKGGAINTGYTLGYDRAHLYYGVETVHYVDLTPGSNPAAKKGVETRQGGLFPRFITTKGGRDKASPATAP